MIILSLWLLLYRCLWLSSPISPLLRHHIWMLHCEWKALVSPLNN